MKVEDFLEHYGVRGQKWGVRRTAKVQEHLDRLNRVAKGTATKQDRAQVAVVSGLATTKQQGAVKALQRGAALQKKIIDGDAFARSLLIKSSNIRIKDLNYHQND